jgi:CDP-diacylglycerol--glycerol-3-phosphate 3-phosphatidyltransferase
LVREQGPWILAALISYAVTSLAGLMKFGKWPSYHTRAAKTSWFLAGIAILFVFADYLPFFAEYSVLALRIATVAVTLTNIEATIMTLVLPTWVADLPSLWHALRLKRRMTETT